VPSHGETDLEGLWVFLTPMSRKDHSTGGDMAFRANKGVVLEATESHRVHPNILGPEILSHASCNKISK
jgi:hypothetical protein